MRMATIQKHFQNIAVPGSHPALNVPVPRNANVEPFMRLLYEPLESQMHLLAPFFEPVSRAGIGAEKRTASPVLPSRQGRIPALQDPTFLETFRQSVTGSRFPIEKTPARHSPFESPSDKSW